MITLTKSMPAPNCLANEKASGSSNYRLTEVLDRLKYDFKNKCYLCEYKEPSTINVEHFIPHRGNRDLMFEWNNLFFVCAHCNNIKSDKYDNILNCVLPEDDVDNKVHLKMDPFPKKKVEITANGSEEVRTKSTVELLEKIYNGSTKLKTIEAENIRNRLLIELCSFQKNLLDYYNLDENDEDDNEERAHLKKLIIKHLKSTSAFTSFKRWVIKDSLELKKEFGYIFE